MAASDLYSMKEVTLDRMGEPQLTHLATWMAHNHRFSPYDQMNRSLLPMSAPTLGTPQNVSGNLYLDIAQVKRVLISEKGKPGQRLFVVTLKGKETTLGFAWISLWNRTLVHESVNEDFTDMSRDHNVVIDHTLRYEPFYLAQYRHEYYKEVARSLRNRRLARLEGNVVQIRDIILSESEHRAAALALLIKKATELARNARTVAIATFPRLHLEFSHELDRQGFRVIGLAKYLFQYLTPAQIAQITQAQNTAAGAPFSLPSTAYADLMLRVYDWDASPEVKSNLNL